MGRRTPIKSKLSVAEQVAILDIVGEVDTLLLQETTAADIARFIQRDRGRLTDVKESTLAKALGERRRELLEAVVVEEEEDMDAGPKGESAAMQDAYRPRIPGAIARGAYQKAKLGVDSLIELESLYLSCRDRIGAIMEWEAENKRFWGDMHKEYSTAAKIIETHAKLTSEMGMGGQDRFSMTLDVRGMRSKYGSSIAEVMSKPESRHKVISLIDQLKEIGQLPEVIDIEPSEE